MAREPEDKEASRELTDDDDFRKVGKEELSAFDLPVDRTFTIVKADIVKKGGIPAKGMKARERVRLWFAGEPKPLLLNRTNGDTIAAIAGGRGQPVTKPKAWAAAKLRITLFATTVRMWDESLKRMGDTPCVRVRPDAPRGPDTPPMRVPTNHAGRAAQAAAFGDIAPVQDLIAAFEGCTTAEARIELSAKLKGISDGAPQSYSEDEWNSLNDANRRARVRLTSVVDHVMNREAERKKEEGREPGDDGDDEEGHPL